MKIMVLLSQAFMLCCIASAFSKTIRFTILYEKALRDFPQKLSKALIDKALDDYNRCLEGTGISFSLDSIMDYTQYSQTREFKPFSGLVGEGSLKKRLRSLENVDTNLVIIYSSTSKDNTSRFNLLSACKGRYFINMLDRAASSGEVLPTSLEAIKDWMSDLLEVNMPEFHELPSASSRQEITNLPCCFVDPALVEELARCSYLFESGRASVNPSRQVVWRPYDESMDLRRKIKDLENQIEDLRPMRNSHSRKTAKPLIGNGMSSKESRDIEVLHARESLKAAEDTDANSDGSVKADEDRMPESPYSKGAFPGEALMRNQRFQRNYAPRERSK